MKNLSVVSLNYDRTFEHYIRDGFYSKLIDHELYQPKDLRQSIQFAGVNSLQVFRPHGYVCSLPPAHNFSQVGMPENLETHANEHRGIRHPGNDSSIPFGDNLILSEDIFLSMGRHMYVVNEQGDSDYKNANAHLSSAQDIFCLGLSTDGICQSLLEFKKGQKVYLSNASEDIKMINQSKSGPEYVSLGTDGERLNACDFPKKYKDICLFEAKETELM